MAEALVLDSEAVNALARVPLRGALQLRARAILTSAYERGALVRIPAPVLAEVCRGSKFDAPVNQLLKDRGIGIFDLSRAIAQRAGELLGATRLSSVHAVDAFVVATALRFDSAVIATGDPGDIRKLLGSHRTVRVFAL